MPASPNDNDLKKQALMKMIGNSQPQMDTIFGVNQPKVPWKQAYESMGMSGAPLSQLQGTSALFAPANAKYNGLGGVSDNKMGYVSPTAGQPALNRAGGPLDVSPAGVAGEATSLVADSAAESQMVVMECIEDEFQYALQIKVESKEDVSGEFVCNFY